MPVDVVQHAANRHNHAVVSQQQAVSYLPSSAGGVKIPYKEGYHAVLACAGACAAILEGRPSP